MADAVAPGHEPVVSPVGRPLRLGTGAPWWTNPGAVVCVLTIPTLAAAYLIPASTYVEAWRTPKSLGGSTATTMAIGLLLLLTGALIAGLGMRRPVLDAEWGRFSQSTATLLGRAFPWLVRGTVLGYVAWFANGVVRHGLRFGDLSGLVLSQDNSDLDVKDKLPTIAGVSTLTQLAIAVVVVGILLDHNRPNKAVRRAYRLVIALAVVRSFFLAERLAVLELVVPLVVLRAAILVSRRPRRRTIVAWAPLLGVLVLVGGFAASEYSRSWTFYAEERDQPFIGFAGERLLGYYATAYNNGALLIEHGSRTDAPPYETIAFVWEAPVGPTRLVPGAPNGRVVTDDAKSEQGDILREHANKEFNSPSGVAAPFVDYGTFGGGAFFVAAGLVLAGLHHSFASGRLWGVLLYPVAFTGLLELPRYLYWAQGRATPPLVALVAIAAVATVRAGNELEQRRRFHDSPATDRARPLSVNS